MNTISLTMTFVIYTQVLVLLYSQNQRRLWFVCPDGQKSIKNLFYNLRLFEPEIFLSRQAPKIVLMIFHDFCSVGA